MDSMDNICFICMDEMNDENKFTLNCNHEFHKQCLEFSVNAKNTNYYNNTSNKECPYCRTKINILTIKEDESPILGIHYINPNCCKELMLSGINKNKICDKKIYQDNVCKYHTYNKRCESFYKSGKNKGKRCLVMTKNFKEGEKVLCGRHSKCK